jgi:hypothetical protein
VQPSQHPTHATGSCLEATHQGWEQGPLRRHPQSLPHSEQPTHMHSSTYWPMGTPPSQQQQQQPSRTWPGCQQLLLLLLPGINCAPPRSGAHSAPDQRYHLLQLLVTLSPAALSCMPHKRPAAARLGPAHGSPGCCWGAHQARKHRTHSLWLGGYHCRPHLRRWRTVTP